MSEVNPVNHPGAASLKSPPKSHSSQNVVQTPFRPPDEAEFSDTARRLSELSEQGVRIEQINRIKKEIAEGKYDTPEKLEMAIDRMLEVEGLAGS